MLRRSAADEANDFGQEILAYRVGALEAAVTENGHLLDDARLLVAELLARLRDDAVA